MKKIKIFIPLLFLLIQTSCYNKMPIERTSVIVGIGQDVGNEKTLSATFEFLVFSSDKKISKTIVTAKGNSIFDMYNKRLLITKKTHLPGTIRLLLISEERAKLGIQDIIDVFLRDHDRNLNTTVAVCKENTYEILDLKPKEASSISEEIEDMVKSSLETNFTQRDIDLKELFNMFYQEGRTIMLPYIEKYKDTVKISGIAVFSKDKMVFKIPEDDSKYINLLRNNNSKGYLTFKEDGLLDSFDILCTSKRKVKTEFKDDKINYFIKLMLKAQIKEANIDNIKELDKDKIESLKKKYSDELKSKLKAIVHEYQSNYGIDIFDIQKFAVAKIGRDKEEFIKNEFETSNINIDVDINVVSKGRLK